MFELKEDIVNKMINYTENRDLFLVGHHCVIENHQQLKDHLGKFKISQKFAVDVINQTNSEESNIYMLECYRLFNNFISSLMSLVDQCRVFLDRNFPTEQYPEFREAVQNKIDTYFENSEIHHFIKKLRNYSLHVQLPVTTGTLFFSKDEPSSHFVGLNKKKLMESNTMNTKAKDYLDRQKEEIDIVNLSNEYIDHLNNYYEWLLTEIDENLLKEEFIVLIEYQKYEQKRIEKRYSDFFEKMENPTEEKPPWL